MKRIAALLNPAGGKGRARRLWKRLRRDFPGPVGDMTLFASRRPGEMEQLARRAAEEGFERILVIGGDGTLFETVNGLMDHSGHPRQGSLAVSALPAGSSCDFLRSFPMPYQFESVLPALQQSPPCQLDLMQLILDDNPEKGSRICLNAASFGLSGKAACSAGRAFAFLPPAIGYLSGFFVHLPLFQPIHAEVTMNGQAWYQGSLWNLFLCNGRFSGGGMLWAPDADMHDGRADVLLIQPVPWRRVPGYVPKLFDGTLQRVAEARTSRVAEMEIRLDRTVDAELDGEPYRFRSIRMKMLPGVLPWIMPVLPVTS